jgi:hypothetical protein
MDMDDLLSGPSPLAEAQARALAPPLGDWDNTLPIAGGAA